MFDWIKRRIHKKIYGGWIKESDPLVYHAGCYIYLDGDKAYLAKVTDKEVYLLMPRRMRD